MTASLRFCGTWPISQQEVNSVVSLLTLVTRSFMHTYSGTPPMPGAFTGYNLATASLICSSDSGLFSSSLTH